jgi:benzoyl-CoA reductase/2-hydroxyglutaryl-CoA dehydratase subunit BcrC/BadD/HgdB
MYRPGLAALSAAQRQHIVSDLIESKVDFPYKDIAVEALDCFNQLIEEVRGSKITIAHLKKILEDKSEQLKKLAQNH